MDILVPILNAAALIAYMLGMGMQVKPEALRTSLRPLSRVALGLVANFILVPAAALGLLLAFDPSPMVAVGFLILAVCAGAPIGPPAAALARGNVPWSIMMMAIMAGLSALISPLVLGQLISQFLTPGESIKFDTLTMVRTLVVAQFLPLAAGLGVQRWSPALAQRMATPMLVAANLMLLFLVGIILGLQYETLAEIRPRGWLGMGLLFAACLVIGWVCGGADAGIRRALAVSTSARNAVVALAIVNSSFPKTEAVTAVLAYGLVSIAGTFLFALALGKLGAGKAAEATAQEPVASA